MTIALISQWFIVFTFYPASIEKCYIEILVEKIEFTKMFISYSVFSSFSFTNISSHFHFTLMWRFSPYISFQSML